MRFHGVPWRGFSIDAPERRRALRRWALRPLLALTGLVWAVVVAALILAHGIDQPWLKRRVQALAHTSAGIDIEYRHVRLAFLSGVAIDGLVVRSPPALRDFAPDLVAIDRVDVRWSPTSLLGRGPAIEELAVSGVALTVVVDEHGRTSFDALPQSAPGTDRSPAVPLSRRPASWLATPPPVARASVDDVVFTVVRTEAGHVAERTALRGVSLSLSTMRSVQGWRVRADLGSPASPLDLRVDRAPIEGATGAARASLWLAIDANSSELAADVDLHVLEQTLAPNLPADESLHAEARARFDAVAGRTELTLDHTDLGQGMATAMASVDLPDSGPAVVRHAQGDVDLARVLRLLPAGLVPITAERARIRYQVDALAAGPVVRLSSGGAMNLDADLANVRVNLAAGSLAIGAGTVSVQGQPTIDGGVAGTASIQLASAALASDRERVAVEDLALDLEGQQSADGALSGHATLRFARANGTGATPVVARDGHAVLGVRDLHPPEVDPLATRGDIVLSLGLATLDARSAGLHAILDGLSLDSHALLEGRAPYAAEIETRASRIRLLADERLVTDAPLRLQAQLHDLFPDRKAPASSRGAGHVTLDVGDLRCSVDATKEVDAVDFSLDFAASSLGAIAPWLPPDLAMAAPWPRMGVAVHSSGRVDRLAGGGPEVEQTTAIHVEQPAFGSAAARSLSLDLASRGSARRGTARADLRLSALAFDGGEPSDDAMVVSASVDREAPSLRVQVETKGRATSKLAASLSFDRARRAAAYDVEGSLASLAPLAPFVSRIRDLEGLDVSKLEAEFSARGALLGVVSEVGRDGSVVLEPHPTQTAGIEGTADVRVAHLRWTHGDTALSAPSVAWHGDMHVEGPRRLLESKVDVDALHVASGQHELDLAGISDDTMASVSGDLLDPKAEVRVGADIRDVHQDALPEYPIGGVALALAAERDPDGMVHVSDLKMTNRAGGTTLGLAGSLDLGARRRRLALTARLAQDLAPLSSAPERFAGQGRVAMDATIESPDLSLFRTRADLKADHVSVRMPGAGLEIHEANGDIPTTTTFEVAKVGESKTTSLRLRQGEERNPYSMLRFADQHALLSRTGFISIASIKTPFASIAPLAGNLAIDQNVASLSQFEMGIRGGRVTGQCALDWEGPKSALELHVRATGVQSSHGEPFDGNVAVVVAAGDRTVDGRAEVLRIGPRHLLDLLDMEDPMRLDPAMNRIRSALAFGYPKRLRLVFDHGFASARLELGGLASLVSLSELKGIPMGPIVDKLLDPIFATKAAP